MKDLEITWLGVAGIVLDYGNHRTVQDPYIYHDNFESVSDRFSIWDLNHIDEVLLTHGHFDHSIDLSTVLEKFDTTAYMNSEVAKRHDLSKHNDAGKIIGLEESVHSFKISDDPDIRLSALRNEHIRFDVPYLGSVFCDILRHNRLFDGDFYKKMFNYPGETPYAFHLDYEGKFKVLTLGSCALIDENKMRLSSIETDLLFLPVQGHSNILGIAYDIVKDVNPKSVYLYHWDNFYKGVGRTVDVNPLVERLRDELGIDNVIVPKYGEKIKIN